MHYRWFYEEGARFASGHLAREVMGGLHLPLFVKRAMLRRRQRNGYTRGDGIGPEAVAGVEADVAALFSQLESHLFKTTFSSRRSTDSGGHRFLWTLLPTFRSGPNTASITSAHSTQYAGVGHAFVE